MLHVTPASLQDMQNLLTIVKNEMQAANPSRVITSLLKISEEILSPTAEWSEAAAPLVERIKKLSPQEFKACYKVALERALPAAFNLDHGLTDSLKEINFDLNPDFFNAHTENMKEAQVREDIKNLNEQSEIVKTLELTKSDLHVEFVKGTPILNRDLQGLVKWLVEIQKLGKQIQKGILGTQERSSFLKKAHTIISKATEYPADYKPKIDVLIREFFSRDVTSSEILPFFQLYSQIPDQACLGSVVSLAFDFIKQTRLKNGCTLHTEFISFLVEQIGSCSKSTLNDVRNFFKDNGQAPRLGKAHPQVVQAYLLSLVTLSAPEKGLEAFDEFCTLLSVEEGAQVIDALADRLLRESENRFKTKIKSILVTLQGLTHRVPLETVPLELRFIQQLLRRYFENPKQYAYVRNYTLTWLKEVLDRHEPETPVSFPGNYSMTALNELISICKTLAPCEPLITIDYTIRAIKEVIVACRKLAPTEELIEFFCDLRLLAKSDAQKEKVKGLFMFLPHPLLCGITKRLFSDYSASKNEETLIAGLFYLDSMKEKMSEPSTFSLDVFNAMIDALIVLGRNKEIQLDNFVFHILDNYHTSLQLLFTEGSREVTTQMLSKLNKFFESWKECPIEGFYRKNTFQMATRFVYFIIKNKTFTAFEKLEYIAKLIECAPHIINILDNIRTFLPLIAVFEREIVREMPKQAAKLRRQISQGLNRLLLGVLKIQTEFPTHIWKYLMPFANNFDCFIDFKGEIAPQLSPLIEFVSKHVDKKDEESCRLFRTFLSTWMTSLERYMASVLKSNPIPNKETLAFVEVISAVTYIFFHQLSLEGERQELNNLKNTSDESSYKFSEDLLFKLLKMVLSFPKELVSDHLKLEFVLEFAFETTLHRMSPSTRQSFMNLLIETIDKNVLADWRVELAACEIYLGQANCYSQLSEKDQSEVAKALYDLLLDSQNENSRTTSLNVIADYFLMLAPDAPLPCLEISYRVLEMFLETTEPVQPLFDYTYLISIFLDSEQLIDRIPDLLDKIFSHAKRLLVGGASTYEKVKAELEMLDELYEEDKTKYTELMNAFNQEFKVPSNKKPTA